MILPDNVLDALHDKEKIKAIKLLREQTGIGLKEAREIVDQYLSNGITEFQDSKTNIPLKISVMPPITLFLMLLVLTTFVWAMINIVEVAGSIIVLWNHSNYRETTFVINRVYYNDDSEAGLTWGFIGRLTDSEDEVKMYAPRLASAKKLGYQKLRRMYPAGMRMKVLYNPGVTDTLFQSRTLRLIPYTPDLVSTEMAVIYHWLLYCLLPFVGALLFAHMVEKRRFHEKIQSRNENNS